MASFQEDKKSYSKLAQIYNSFQEDFSTTAPVVQKILKKEGDINYKIPSNSCVRWTEPNLIGCTALHFAAMKNETKVVTILLNNSADFTVKNQDNHTALHCAVDQVSPEKELIDIILSKQHSMIVTCNPCDANGLSHFHIACLYNHADAVNFFLNCGIPLDVVIDSDAKKIARSTPLHYAAEGSAVSVIHILLKYNAKMNVRNAKGLTPLHILIEKKIKLFDSYNTSDERVPNDGTIAAIEGAMNLLLDINDVDDIGLTQFHIACTQRDVSLVEYYLEQNIVDINQAVRMDSPIRPGYTGLHFAAHCNLDIVKKLLKNNADFEAKDASGVTPMDLLWMKYKGEDLRMILMQNWKCTTFSDKETRLIDFIKFAREPKVMRQYLSHVKDIRTTMEEGPSNWKGRTLLHFAVMLRESSEMIRLCTRRQQFALLVDVPDFSGSTPIHLAFRLHKHDVVENLMNCRKDVRNLVDVDGLSYLHIACAMVKHRYVKKVNCDDENINVAYHGSTTYGWITPGSTALHVAIDSGNSKIIDTILEHEFDIEAKDDNGQTPLDRFLRLDDNEAVSVCRVLLWNQAVTNDMIKKIGLTRLHMAIHCRESSIRQFINQKEIKAVIECRDSSSFLYVYDGCTPLHMAIMRGSKIDTVRSLMEQGSNLLVKNRQGDTPLYSALSRSPDWRGMDVIVEILLSNETLRRQMEEMSGITMLHIACYTVNFNAVLWILTGPVDVNARVSSDYPIWSGCTPLHVLMKTIEYRGVTDDLLKILEMIIKAGAKVTNMGANEETPIHLPLRNFPIQRIHTVLNPLIENLRIYDVNPVGRNGMSHFHAACLVNNVKIVKSFLENGADVDQPIDFFAKDFAGDTPLHLAVEHETEIGCKRETVSVLLRYGADVKAEDNLGQTALHKAVTLSGNLNILEMFVEHGAVVNARNIFEQTPLEMLLKSKNVSVKKIKFFELCGCRLNVSNPMTEEGYISVLISLSYHPEYKSGIVVVTQCFNSVVDAIDWSVSDDMGRNLIHNIVTTNNPHCDIFKYDDLIKRFQLHGVDIDLQDKKGKTALHLAAQFGNLLAVGALLDSGADVNVLDATNMTPLNYAMTYCDNNEKVIECLVYHVGKLQQLNLEVNQNNICETARPWSFVSNQKHKLILSTVRFYVILNYQNEIDESRSVLVNDHPRLFLEDFLSETGKGLTSYSIMPNLRIRVDDFFREYNGGDLKDVCALQYRKAVKRVSLVELAVDSVLAIARTNVPIECIEMIFQYLTNSDLRNTIKAATLLSKNIVTDERS